MTGIESIKDGFPYPVINKFPGRPTYDSIAAVHTKLKANAASVHSNLGGGAHGFLGLALQPGTYTVLTGRVFVPPSNPGPTANLPGGLTGPQINEHIREYEQQLKIWKQYNTVEQALKQQLIASFDDIYFKSVSNRHTGFASLTLLKMLQHLYDTYGDLTPTELEDNDERMRSPYDPSTPIETLYDQIEQAVDIAEAGHQPYTNAQVLTRAYNIILQTGLFTDACREWRNKPRVDKTWETFKVHFAQAHKDLRQHEETAARSGMHAANSVLDSIQQDATLAIQQLTNATMADRNQITELVQAKTNMSRDMQTLQDNIMILQAQVAALMRTTVPVPIAQSLPTRSRRNPNSQAYCWTHGRTYNDLHTSLTCKHRKPDHKETATLFNRIGGSNKNCGT